MKRGYSLIALMSMSIFMSVTIAAFPYKKDNVKQNKKLPLEQIVQSIDSISKVDIAIVDTAGFYQPTMTSSYLIDLSKKIDFDYKEVSLYYEDRMMHYSSAQQEDSLEQTCKTVIIMNDTTNMPMAYEGLSQIYAMRGDTHKLKKVLDNYECLSSKLSGNPYKDVIEQLRDEYDDVLHPIPFSERVRGLWVSYDVYNRFSTYPYITLNINDITNNNGIQLVHSPGETPIQNSLALYPLRTSQYIGGYDGYIEAVFGSEKLNRGDDSFAKSGFESTRKFRAEMRGNIATSKADFSKKLAVSVTTELTASLLDALFSSTAQSYKQVAALNLQLEQESPIVLKGSAEYYNYVVSVDQMYYKPRPVYSGEMHFVKWESSDGVYFIDNGGNINSVTPISQLDLTDYNEIKEKYSWKRPKYWLPIVGGELLGAAMMTGGIMICSNATKKDANGNPVYDEDGIKEVDTGKIVGGVFSIVAGIITMELFPVIISQNRINRRSLAFAALNLENMQRLEQKAKLSIQPDIDSGNKSLVLNTNIKF